jgi:DNA-binding response OmpR family regulator
VPPQAPRILIVEDQLETAEMLTSYLEAQGYEVTSVGWGEDALAFAEKVTPDLVMLDIRLPDIDGYEVYRYLRCGLHYQAVRCTGATPESAQCAAPFQVRASLSPHHRVAGLVVG